MELYTICLVVVLVAFCGAMIVRRGQLRIVFIAAFVVAGAIMLALSAVDPDLGQTNTVMPTPTVITG